MSSRRFQKPIFTVVTSAPFVCKTMAFGFVLKPSIFASKAGTDTAWRSAMFCRTASFEVRLEAFRTAESAQVPLRPWVAASERALLA